MSFEDRFLQIVFAKIFGEECRIYGRKPKFWKQKSASVLASQLVFANALFARVFKVV
jgi:hypothetical protein